MTKHNSLARFKQTSDDAIKRLEAIPIAERREGEEFNIEDDWVDSCDKMKPTKPDICCTRFGSTSYEYE